MSNEQGQNLDRLGSYLLQNVVRFDAGKEDALSMDERIGQALEADRKKKGLKQRDVVRLVGAEGFGTDELVALETGLISLKDISETVDIKLVQVLTDVPDAKQVYQQVVYFMDIGKVE